MKRLKKIALNSGSAFENVRKTLIQNKRSFQYITCGSTPKIIFSGKEFSRVEKGKFAGKGHHISTMFKKDVDAWISKNEKNLKPYSRDYREQMFCLEHIEEAIGRPLVMIDISGCYWQTAYKLGYMSRETYIAARRKNEWKEGRNASIGGLCKKQYITQYKKGVPVNELRQVIEPKKEYQYIRNHIIGTVYKMFYRLYDEILGRKFYMFLTDAVVTTPDMAHVVIKEFWMNGYLSKQKTVEFTKVDRKKRVVEWIDYTAPVEEIDENGNRKVIGRCAEKYYNYAQHQVVEERLL